MLAHSLFILLGYCKPSIWLERWVQFFSLILSRSGCRSFLRVNEFLSFSTSKSIGLTATSRRFTAIPRKFSMICPRTWRIIVPFRRDLSRDSVSGPARLIKIVINFIVRGARGNEGHSYKCLSWRFSNRAFRTFREQITFLLISLILTWPWVAHLLLA